jgi:alcohol dehydrogenase (cytochrome c)
MRLHSAATRVIVTALCLVTGALVRPAGQGGATWYAPPTADFPLAGGSYTNQRYSSLNQITTANIKQLGGAWTMRVQERGQGGTLDGTPIVIDGVMYVTTGTRNVIAIDAATGTVKWRYSPSEEGRTGANKGVVVADGKVIFGRRDNTLVALDKETGRLVWQTRTTTQQAAYSSAAPVYYDGLVFIGLAGGDNAVRGHIAAYDVKTGREVWKFNTIPGPNDRFSNTWEQDAHRWGGGVWNHVALDPELGLIYVGVGNAGPDTDGRLRGGDNLFTASILALDLRTGAYKWHFQEVHHDVWDYDAASPPVLADISYRGRPRKVLMHPGKTGYLYILDRTNGKSLIGISERPVRQEPRLKTARTQPYPVGDRFVPLCAEPLGDFEPNCLFGAFWEKPVLIFPGSSGGNAWAPMTFSPLTNLAYIPANVMSTLYSSKHDEFDETTRTFKKIGGGDGFVRPPGARRSGTLTAIDPTTNRIVWQQVTKYPMGTGSGLLSTAGGLLFHGESDGHLVAYDIRNGEELWKFQTGAGANGPVSTFAVAGEQYVSVLAGGNNVLLSPRGDFLWTFKLGGTLPEAPPPTPPPTIHPGPAPPPR